MYTFDTLYSYSGIELPPAGITDSDASYAVISSTAVATPRIPSPAPPQLYSEVGSRKVYTVCFDEQYKAVIPVLRVLL